MDTLNITCPHCFEQGAVDASFAGRRIRCSRCNTVFLLDKVAEPVPAVIVVPVKIDPGSPPDMLVNHMDGAEMLHIPAGEFTMGSTAAEIDAIIARQSRAKTAQFEGEQPQHRVNLDGFYIYKHPVTVAQYRGYCESTGQEFPREASWPWEDSHPMMNVSWHDASAYAEWAGVSLPTEAQWEKAARGTEGLAYPWGNMWDPTKCCNGVGKGRIYQTAPVGAHPAGASSYGVQDMAGNVCEWCLDWYFVFYYQTTPARNPPGPAHALQRVIRGGSWHELEEYTLRCAYRGISDPTQKVSYIGFRCATCGPAAARSA